MSEQQIHPYREDGRCLRGRRTRERLIEAARASMRAGNFQPSVVTVAKGAGTSTRGVFQHFQSQHALYAAALEDPVLVRDLAERLVGAELPEVLAKRVVLLAVCGATYVAGAPVAPLESRRTGSLVSSG